MTLYVQARVGRHLVLLPAVRVLEIWSQTATEELGRWRERALPVVDLPRLLGAQSSTAETTQAAYGAGPDDPEAVVLRLDAVIGLLTLEAAALAPLPSVSADAGRLFDAVTRAPIGEHHLLRLKERPDFEGIAA